VPKPTPGEEELALAKTLIEASTPQKLDFAKYQDRYAIRLTELIQKKVAGEGIMAPPAHEQAPVINLMDALRASLAQVQKGQPEEAAKPPKKIAPSVRHHGNPHALTIGPSVFPKTASGSCSSGSAKSGAKSRLSASKGRQEKLLKGFLEGKGYLSKQAALRIEGGPRAIGCRRASRFGQSAAGVKRKTGRFGSRLAIPEGLSAGLSSGESSFSRQPLIAN
jgi:hypothetical protein